jgi:hypothetical protein
MAGSAALTVVQPNPAKAFCYRRLAQSFGSARR